MEHIYKKLLTYSYNIVGSYEDARDLVQDVMEKYLSVDKDHVRDESNFLIRSVINHSINFKQRNQRIAPFGVWLPEPHATESPESNLIKENTANYSLLVLMEKLNARERAVFILREAFDYSHEEIAAVLDISTDNSRKIFSRAKKNLQEASVHRDKFLNHKLTEYIDALIHGEVETLERLLIDDIRVFADGGSKVQVVSGLATGRAKSIELLLYVYQNFQKHYSYEIGTINHEPAILFYQKNDLVNCQVFRFSEGQIVDIYSVIDPEKLRNIRP